MEYFVVKFVAGRGKMYLSSYGGWVEKKIAKGFRDIHEATRFMKTKCSGDYDVKIVKEAV